MPNRKPQPERRVWARIVNREWRATLVGAWLGGRGAWAWLLTLLDEATSWSSASTSNSWFPNAWIWPKGPLTCGRTSQHFSLPPAVSRWSVYRTCHSGRVQRLSGLAGWSGLADPAGAAPLVHV